ncbi:glycoside hydrolase family 3 N-terminal domain-containing protein [Candidatus Riflebacteria bacterium]
MCAHNLTETNRKPSLPSIKKNSDLYPYLGQLFIFGFQGKEPEGDVLKYYAQEKISGLVFFSRNIKNLKELKQSISLFKSRLPLKPFFAVDQEGGVVVRLAKGLQVPPGNMAIAASGKKNNAFQAGVNTGIDLKDLGFNINFAPVMDIDLCGNPCIGARAFSDKASIVKKYGVQYIEGLQSCGISATAKHFPGYGHCSVDPHLDLPTLTKNRAELEKNELIPFRAAIEKKVDLVMTTHMVLPEIDDRIVTFSSRIVDGLLKKELGFAGVVISDDLEMGALNEDENIGELALQSIISGHDIVLICHSFAMQKKALNYIKQAYRKGLLPHYRVWDALNRIFKLKRKQLFKKDDKLPTYDTQLSLKVGRQGLLLHGQSSRIPLSAKEKYILVIVKYKHLTLVEDEKFFNGKEYLINSLEESGIPIEVFKMAPKPTKKELCTLESRCNKGQICIFLSYNAHLEEKQQQAIRLCQRKSRDLILVSLRNPYDLKNFSYIPTRIATFGFRKENYLALADLLLGKRKASGKLPVAL